MPLTPHQAKYIAHDLTLQHAGGGLDRLSPGWAVVFEGGLMLGFKMQAEINRMTGKFLLNLPCLTEQDAA